MKIYKYTVPRNTDITEEMLSVLYSKGKDGRVEIIGVYAIGEEAYKDGIEEILKCASHIDEIVREFGLPTISHVREHLMTRYSTWKDRFECLNEVYEVTMYEEGTSFGVVERSIDVSQQYS